MPVERKRAAHLADFADTSHRHHQPLTVTHFQALDILQLVAKLGIGLHHNLPVAVKQGEIIDVHRSLKDLQGVSEIPWVDATGAALPFIGQYPHLGYFGTEHAEQPAQACFSAFADKHLHLFLQRLGAQVPAVFQHEREAPRAADAAHGRRCQHSRLTLVGMQCEGNAQALHHLFGVQLGISAILVGCQTDEHGAEIGASRIERERLP